MEFNACGIEYTKWRMNQAGVTQWYIPQEVEGCKNIQPLLKVQLPTPP
jgi:hypothetical protein